MIVFTIRLSRIIPLLLLSISLVACTSSFLHKSEHMSRLNNLKNTEQPKSVVILPFENETDEIDIENVVRISFYNHFSSKNYRDFELGKIDIMLKALEKNLSQSWRDKSPTDLADYLNTDYLIYGRAKEYKKIYLGIYSQIALRVYVEMVEGRNGDIVFSKDILKRSHDGGLPFDPISLIPAAVRSGMNMKRDKTVELTDRIIKEIVELIPDQSIPLVNPHFVDIQIASFLDNERARKVLNEFIGMGLNTRIETVILDNRQWHRVLLGPYFNLEEAREIMNRIARNNRFKPFIIEYNNEGINPDSGEKQL